ncbi:hypothetical protein Tco_0676723 [Tanacetum coccineum]
MESVFIAVTCFKMLNHAGEAKKNKVATNGAASSAPRSNRVRKSFAGVSGQDVRKLVQTVKLSRQTLTSSPVSAAQDLPHDGVDHALPGLTLELKWANEEPRTTGKENFKRGGENQLNHNYADKEIGVFQMGENKQNSANNDDVDQQCMKKKRPSLKWNDFHDDDDIDLELEMSRCEEVNNAAFERMMSDRKTDFAGWSNQERHGNFGRQILLLLTYFDISELE